MSCKVNEDCTNVITGSNSVIDNLSKENEDLKSKLSSCQTDLELIKYDNESLCEQNEALKTTVDEYSVIINNSYNEKVENLAKIEELETSLNTSNEKLKKIDDILHTNATVEEVYRVVQEVFA